MNLSCEPRKVGPSTHWMYLSGEKLAILSDDDHLSWVDIPYTLKGDGPKRAVLAGHTPFVSIGTNTLAKNQRPAWTHPSLRSYTDKGP